MFWFISDFAIKIVHRSTMNNHSQSVINFKGIYVWYELSTHKWFAYFTHKTISRIRRLAIELYFHGRRFIEKNNALF